MTFFSGIEHLQSLSLFDSQYEGFVSNHKWILINLRLNHSNKIPYIRLIVRLIMICVYILTLAKTKSNESEKNLTNVSFVLLLRHIGTIYHGPNQLLEVWWNDLFWNKLISYQITKYNKIWNIPLNTFGFDSYRKRRVLRVWSQTPVANEA